MAKIDRVVVRNQSYQKGGVGIRERHNERKNESYCNPDIAPERSHMNLHFKRCEGTYTQSLDRMIADGSVSTRGLKENAKVFGELVFDVNTKYFDKYGGYDYATHFFEEAFRFAEILVGSQYILSAVMHADEKNRALSAELGRDVYHYHLHVIYIPVVEKEIRWTKRCKDKALVGTVKEVVQQISHSKMWAFQPLLDEQGKPVLSASGKPKRIPSYSLLQDMFFEYMRDKGFGGFERGVRGSTTEHLSVLDYKIQQDKQHLEGLTAQISEQKTELGEIHQELSAVKTVKTAFDDVTAIGKKKLLSSKIEMSAEEYDKLQNLAKEGLAMQRRVAELNQQLSDLRWHMRSQKGELDELYKSTKGYFAAMRIAPERVKEALEAITHRSKEAKEQVKQQVKQQPMERKKSPWAIRTGGRDAR